MDSEPPMPVSDISSPVWPRRASRACASCRRDKIRCDGARPCTGCSKKGFTADQCVDGCDPCRRARVRCEDGKPCQRCRDLHIECLEEVTTSFARHGTPMTSVRTPRANVTDRAKLACTNCRRDNKKCDDQRPCGRCVARSEECVHVGRGPKLVKLRCEGCRQENKRCDDGRPCRHCIEGGRQCITMPRKGRGHGTRVKAACMGCRRDKIRCDGVRPCASCVRKGLECVERACKSCNRDGTAAECTHRQSQNSGAHNNTENPSEHSRDDNAHASSSSSDYRSIQQPPPLQMPPHAPHAHLPPIQHPPGVYDSPSGHGPPPGHHYYYRTPHHIIGPGQPPSMMPQYIHEQRSAYYPVIDPNIDSAPASSSSMYPGGENHS